MRIQDESGDKKYFTIIPNYILNHSTATDQALYMQMKRIAGEGGKCSAGVRYFMKQLGVGQKAIKKSFDYLIEHKWIDFTGKENVVTEGGVQKVNTYKVNDIWKINAEHYQQGVSGSIHLKDQGVSRRISRCIPKGGKGVSEGIRKKNYKKELKEQEEIFIPGIGRMKTFKGLKENG